MLQFSREKKDKSKLSEIKFSQLLKNPSIFFAIMTFKTGYEKTADMYIVTRHLFKYLKWEDENTIILKNQ